MGVTFVGRVFLVQSRYRSAFIANEKWEKSDSNGTKILYKYQENLYKNYSNFSHQTLISISRNFHKIVETSPPLPTKPSWSQKTSSHSIHTWPQLSHTLTSKFANLHRTRRHLAITRSLAVKKNQSQRARVQFEKLAQAGPDPQLWGPGHRREPNLVLFTKSI